MCIICYSKIFVVVRLLNPMRFNLTQEQWKVHTWHKLKNSWYSCCPSSFAIFPWYLHEWKHKSISRILCVSMTLHTEQLFLSFCHQDLPAHRISVLWFAACVISMNTWGTMRMSPCDSRMDWFEAVCALKLKRTFVSALTIQNKLHQSL
jgi:hypothetical protein